VSWVVWRQGRSENVLILALLGAVALLLVLTGAHMRSVFDANGLTACTGGSATSPPGCSILVQDFQSRFDALNTLTPWFGMAAGLIGVSGSDPWDSPSSRGGMLATLSVRTVPGVTPWRRGREVARRRRRALALRSVRSACRRG
jgi:hypothetical protein